MRKVSIQLAVTAMVLVALCLIYRAAFGDTITMVCVNPGFDTKGQWTAPPKDLIVKTDGAGVVELESIKADGNSLFLKLKALSTGDEFLQLRVQGEEECFVSIFCNVDKYLGFSIDSAIFAGEFFVLVAVGFFLLLGCVYFLLFFLAQKGGEIYSYLSIFSAGMTIFMGFGAVGVLGDLVQTLMDPLGYSVIQALASISRMSANCMAFMTIPMLAFAFSMIISNIELLKHERLRFANVLGILIPVAMILGETALILFDNMYFSGSFEEYRLRTVIFEVLCTIYVYFECMLAGSVICGIRAVKHRVPYDRDYIIILGCKFRNDGSLTPLLQGRCDRAISFWKQQKEKTGKEAVIIPSGGQGPDESMPEAEAMARYLLTQDIPERAIIREQESKNTYQNMQFSKKIIEAAKPDAKVAFSTTNYHVFRSGLWASLAGLEAEGMGGVTKWWFWPNAFMRECVGLMANRVRQEAVLLLIIIVVCIVLSFVTIR